MILCTGGTSLLRSWSRLTEEISTWHLLTGHVALNYHLSKLSRNINPTCPLCEAEDETVSHVFGQLRAELFYTYYSMASDIVDRHSLRQIPKYTNRTKPLEHVTS